MIERNLIFEAIEEIGKLTSLPSVATRFANTMEQLGFTTLGINGLPPPGEDADPVILAESTPEGFRDFYIHERFYSIDHICAHARVSYEPFRYSDAPYDQTKSRDHERFVQGLHTFGMGMGVIVPVGRPANVPACVWLAGEDPNLDNDAMTATQLVSLFAASKADALYHSRGLAPQTSSLSSREREVLQWICAGKTSWEIGAILGLTERMINKIIGEAMVKLDAVTRTQAVVNAIRLGDIEL